MPVRAVGSRRSRFSGGVAGGGAPSYALQPNGFAWPTIHPIVVPGPGVKPFWNFEGASTTIRSGPYTQGTNAPFLTTGFTERTGQGPGGTNIIAVSWVGAGDDDAGADWFLDMTSNVKVIHVAMVWGITADTGKAVKIIRVREPANSFNICTLILDTHLNFAPLWDFWQIGGSPTDSGFIITPGELYHIEFVVDIRVKAAARMQLYVNGNQELDDVQNLSSASPDPDDYDIGYLQINGTINDPPVDGREDLGVVAISESRIGVPDEIEAFL